MSTEDFDRPSLTDVAYRKIRDSIFIGSLLSGDRLVVNDLVERWKISNTPIKEALNRLVAEGLVEALPRRGMRIRLLTAKELREIMEIRTLYEIHCCRKAVEKIAGNPHVLEEMQATLKKVGNILNDERNVLLQFHLDEMFHMLIVSLCGNNMMIKDYDRIHATFLLVGIHANRKEPLRRLKESYEEHKNILFELERRSADGIELAMRVHLTNTLEGILVHYHPKSGRFMSK